MSTAPQHAELLVADGLLTIAEAAAFLRVSRSTIYSLLEHGALPSVRVGRARRLPRRALVAFAAANLHGGQEW